MRKPAKFWRVKASAQAIFHNKRSRDAWTGTEVVCETSSCHFMHLSWKTITLSSFHKTWPEREFVVSHGSFKSTFSLCTTPKWSRHLGWKFLTFLQIQSFDSILFRRMAVGALSKCRLLRRIEIGYSTTGLTYWNTLKEGYVTSLFHQGSPFNCQVYFLCKLLSRLLWHLFTFFNSGWKMKLNPSKFIF